MNSIKKLYYSIGEVSKITELKQYVLRYWETEFKQLSPVKNKAGNRTYRQKDIDIILKIKDLLYNQKFTIDGARHVLSMPSNAEPEQSSEQVLVDSNDIDIKILHKIRTELKSILDNVK